MKVAHCHGSPADIYIYIMLTYDSFFQAEEAGKISVRQYKLSKMLGDDSLAARSILYSALSQAQKNNLKLSRYIVRSVYIFGINTKDKRLVRMCQGVWAKLKYLRQLQRNSLNLTIECKGDGQC